MTVNENDRRDLEMMNEEEIYGTGSAETVRGMEDTQTTAEEEGLCACCHHKNTPREDREQKQLQNRINRIIGQLNGIRNMIDDNRYCGDILIQIGAVESALQSLGYIILKDHLQTCVVEEVKRGNEAIMEEAVELIKKLK